MNILLTNDDGYDSVGIQALYEVLSKNHIVKLCAPLTQQSATGHSVNLFKALKLNEVPSGYALDGTPADCVKVALFGVYKKVDFDIVISGINKGINMGCDIFYSGTVAAAREGLINGIPGIACSIARQATKKNYIDAAIVLEKLIMDFKNKIFKKQAILNINFPIKDEYDLLKITHLGKRTYNETIYTEEKEDGKYVSIVGECDSFLHSEGSDLNCVDEGYISITPLSNEYFVPKLIDELVKITTEYNRSFE